MERHHDNQALGWRLNFEVSADLEHRPGHSHFTQRHTFCSLTGTLVHMVERELKTSFNPFQHLQSWQASQRDVGKAKSQVQQSIHSLAVPAGTCAKVFLPHLAEHRHWCT